MGSFSIAYWASLDDILGNEDDMPVGVEVISDPAGLEAGTHTGLVMLPIDVPGSYLLFAVLDSGGQIAEADESNNAVQALAVLVVTVPSDIPPA